MSQFVVGFDLTTKKIGEFRYKQRRASRWTLTQQLAQVGIFYCEFISDLPHHLFGPIHHTLGIDIPLETRRLTSKIIRRKALNCQQSDLSCLVEFGQALRAEIRRRSLKANALVLQEEAHLLTDALVIAGCEEQLDLAEYAVSCQSETQGLPGTVVRPGKCFGECLAMIGDVLFDKVHNINCRNAGQLACVIASHDSDGLPQTETD